MTAQFTALRGSGANRYAAIIRDLYSAIDGQIMMMKAKMSFAFLTLIYVLLTAEQ